MSTRRFTGILLILLAFFFVPFAGFAYASDTCQVNATVCTEKEVGPFLEGISIACGNFGDCSFGDILVVFINIGRFVLGIIGSLVLLFYIIGGFYFLASHGDQNWITKGKTYIRNATIGLLIVMFAYLIVFSIAKLLCGGFDDPNNETCKLLFPEPSLGTKIKTGIEAAIGKLF